MRNLRLSRCALGLAVVSSACSSKSPATVDATKVVDAKPTFDAWGGPKSVPCANTFGQALTAGFGRLDGTVLAIVPPDDQECMDPNSTHLVLQLTMGGQAYRMVVNVQSETGVNDDVFFEMDAPLVGAAWADGWHIGIPLDYAMTLHVPSSSFVSHTAAELVSQITSEINLGDHVSVFATNGTTEPDSAHLVHRNATNADGAIVLAADGANPHWLLFAFQDQTF